MKTIVEKRLFWFLKDGTELDLSNKSHVDMYVQQTLTRGKASDIRGLLRMINLSEFLESFNRIKDFLPKEVKRFWEEWLANINKSSEKNP
jgi:hypothetical protein